ncbi:HDOD domain-containing protein [Aromatoleum diolicum]|uniref:HDOD domain-containing protein n=1 Tax=Aromatoleum diolicum TaxID=75796 RepID=A0ABX1QCY7_9RHOO|nr:HDOD domain-containing protein [Aromatoleum diolicum]NMG74965.1 HDOD domain-containing protein [Aromatoleum diolicum]
MQDFEAQAHAFGEQIEAELAEGHLSFPTALDISLRIKRLADSPDSSLDEIATVVKAEPVLSAKAVRMANAVALNPYSAPITNVSDAVQRIGLASLRCLAFAVAAEQLAQDHRSPRMRTLASGLWMHSVDVAAWAYALAHELKIANPDTAMFGGMMIDIGQFLLVARAADYPALETNIERFAEFVSTWNEPIGRAVLETFELPESILDAFECGNPYGGSWPPTDLSDLIFVASLAAETPNPFDKLLGNDRRLSLLDTASSRIDKLELEELLDAARTKRQIVLAAVCG